MSPPPLSRNAHTAYAACPLKPGCCILRRMRWQFFWDLVLVGLVMIVAARVAVVLDRDHRLSPPAKWGILIGLVLIMAIFLSLFRLYDVTAP